MQSHTAASLNHSPSLGAHIQRRVQNVSTRKQKGKKCRVEKKNSHGSESNRCTREKTSLAACRDFKGAFTLGGKAETNWNTDAAVTANRLANAITQNAL